jgi:hypothetical protein
MELCLETSVKSAKQNTGVEVNNGTKNQLKIKSPFLLEALTKNNSAIYLSSN